MVARVVAAGVAGAVPWAAAVVAAGEVVVASRATGATPACSGSLGTLLGTGGARDWARGRWALAPWRSALTTAR